MCPVHPVAGKHATTLLQWQRHVAQLLKNCAVFCREERNVTMEVACSTPPVMVKKTTFVGLTKKQLTQANLATLRKAANQGKDAALVKRAQNEAAVLKAANMAEAEAAVVAAKHAEVKAALVAARMADEQAAAAAVNPAEVADVAPTHLPKR